MREFVKLFVGFERQQVRCNMNKLNIDRRWRRTAVFVAALPLTVFAENPTANNPIPPLLYTADAASPSVQGPAATFGPADVLRFPGPTVVIPRQNLGLQDVLDDIDGLGRLTTGVGPNASFVIRFSVDRATVGGTDPDPNLVADGFPYNAKQQAALNQAAGDDYFSLTLYQRSGPIATANAVGPVGNHTQGRNQGDAGGVGYSLDPEISPEIPATPPVDNLDGGGKSMASLTTGAPEPILFSLTANSPSLMSLPGPQSGAVIFIDESPNQPGGETIYALPIQLNLSPMDDINAFVVFDDGDGVFNRATDQVLFSLSPKSESVIQGIANPGDIYTTTPQNNALFASANDLGLLPTDDIDMLNFEICNDINQCVQDWAIGNKPPTVPAGSWWSYGFLLVTVAGVGVWVLRSQAKTA